MTTESQKYNSSAESDEVSLKEIILNVKKWAQYLLSKWVIIVFFSILGGALGFCYATLKKPVYIATTTFVLEEGEKSGGLSGLGGIASMAGIDLGSGGGGIFQGDNILQLYKSRTMIEKTLFTKTIFNEKEQLLINQYIIFNGLKKKWDKVPLLHGINFLDSAEKRTRVKDSIISVIVNDINKNYLSVAKPDKKLSVIQADVKAEDEIFAKNFNEAIVKNVNDFYIQTKTKKSTYNVKILQSKTDSVREVMNGAIYKAASIADATPNLNPTRQIQRIAPVQKAQFSAETNKAILNSLVQNLEMAKVSLLKEAPLIQVIDEPIYPLKIEKIGKIKGSVLGAILALIVILFCLIIIKVSKDAF